MSGVAPTPEVIETRDPNEEALVEDAENEAEEPALTPAEPPAGRPQLRNAVEGGPARAPVMEPTDPDGKFAVQLGAFSVRANAQKLAREVQGYVEDSGALAIVRVGPFATRGQAEEALAKLRSRGYSDALIRPLD